MDIAVETVIAEAPAMTVVEAAADTKATVGPAALLRAIENLLSVPPAHAQIHVAQAPRAREMTAVARPLASVAAALAIVTAEARAMTEDPALPTMKARAQCPASA